MEQQTSNNSVKENKGIYTRIQDAISNRTILSSQEFFNLLRSAYKEFPQYLVVGNITYCQHNWKTWYSNESRTYTIGNHNNYFNPEKISKALYGNNLDGTDKLVRLDYYDWDIDYCTITKIKDTITGIVIWDQSDKL